MKVCSLKQIDFGIVQPWAKGPFTHTSNKDKDYEEDQHGLFPIVLWKRSEGINSPQITGG